MSPENIIPTIDMNELDFSEAPAFCRNGMSFVNGKGIRFTKATRLTTSEQQDIIVDKGSVLFRDREDGRLTLHKAEEFERDFSRYLKNGSHVRLSRADNIQLIEIRQAEDADHLRDWAVSKGRELADNSRAAYQRLVMSEIVCDLAMMAGDFGTGAHELSKDLRERAATAWNAPGNQPMREQIGRHMDGLKKGLKKLAWGKLGNGS